MLYTDTHAHLSLVAEELGLPALEAVLSAYSRPGSEMQDAALVLDPGTGPEDLEPRARLLEEVARSLALPDSLPLSSFLRIAAGLWPLPEYLRNPRLSMEKLNASIHDYRPTQSNDRPHFAAIGEGGLDYHYPEGLEGGLKAAQAELFQAQMDLASELKLPFILHSRDAADDTIAILKGYGSLPQVIVHCFGYGPKEASIFLELGCYVSFAGNLTFKKSEGLCQACVLVPGDRLLLETDAPYMNPMPNRGKPSSPLDVPRSYAFAAALRDQPVEDLALQVTRNAHRLFD